ncbi:MAG: calcium-binding protein [Pseudomonadota bacterium]
MATFTFDEGNAFSTGFGPGQDNVADVIDNGVTFRFTPGNAALGGTVSGAPGTAAPLKLTATSAGTSFVMTVPASNVPGSAQFADFFLINALSLTGAWTITATDTGGNTTNLTPSGSFFLLLQNGSYVSLTFTATVAGSLTLASLQTDLTPAVAQNDAFTVFAMNPVSPGENVLGDVVGDVHSNNGSGADTDADGELSVSAVNGVSVGGATVTTGLGATVVMLADGRFRYDGTASTTLQQLALGATAIDSFTYANINSNTATVTLTVQGTGGRTVIDGDGGDDTLTPDVNFHYVLSGAGNDMIIYDRASVPNYTGSIVDGQAGTNDTLRLEYAGNDGPYTFDLTGISLTGIETIDVVRTAVIIDNGVNVNLTPAQVAAIQNFDGDVTDRVEFVIAMGNTTTLDLRGKQVTSGAELNVRGDDDPEVIDGSAFADDVQDGGGNDLVYGGAGNDDFEGIGSGADTVFGGDNDDGFGGDLAGDSIFGGAGNDNVQLFASGGIAPTGMTLDGGTGTDQLVLLLSTFDLRTETVLGFETLEYNQSSTQNAVGAKFTATQIQQFSTILLAQTSQSIADPTTEIDMDNAVEQLDLSGITVTGFGSSTVASCQFVVNGDASNESITGSTLCDVIYGNGGNDTLDGGVGNDFVYGGFGNDTILGGQGANSFDGGTGTADVLSYENGARRYNIDPSRGTSIFDFTGSVDQIANFEIFKGTAFADRFEGSATADTFFGGGGNDDIVGSAGNDVIYGGAANDFISGYAGNASLYGDEGTDTFSFSANPQPGASGLWDGGADNDLIRIDTSAGAITNPDLTTIRFVSIEELLVLDSFGLNQPTTVKLTGAQAAVLGRFTSQSVPVTIDITMGPTTTLDLSGKIVNGISWFIIRGDDEVESISGSSVTDVFYGGGGADTLSGNGGNDAVSGGSAGDFIYGGVGNDNLRGDGDNDTIFGGQNDDRLFGGLGDDKLFGGLGNDVVYGGTGNDEFSYRGTDTVFAGANNDELQVVTGAALTAGLYDGGADTDELEVLLDGGGLNVRGLTLTSVEILNFDDAFDDSFAEVVQFTGDQAAGFQSILMDPSTTVTIEIFMEALTTLNLSSKSITGTPVIIVRGDSDAESISGSSVNDIIYGGGGADTLSGNGGNDAVFGGSVGDIIYGGVGGDRVRGAGGNDTIHGDGDNDFLFGGAGNDVIYGGANGNNPFSGDEIYGGNNDDVLYGGTGNDSVNGDLGSDTIEGGIGGDSLDGGGGIDTLSYAGSAAGVVVNLLTRTASGGDAAGDRISNFQNLIGSNFNDTLTGEVGVNNISGRGGNDALYGGEDTDILYGGAGNDTLHGDDSFDALFGGVGDRPDLWRRSERWYLWRRGRRRHPR